MPADEKLPSTIPWFGARKLARALLTEVQGLREQRDEMRNQIETLGILSVLQLEAKRASLERETAEQASRLEQERSAAAAAAQALRLQLDEARKSIVETEDLALLQEAGIYRYRHPLTDAVAYAKELAGIEDRMKAMTRKDGGAVQATTSWTANGSAAQGRAMVRDFSKLMLRAFNAEADNLVRGLKPYKLAAAVERLNKVAKVGMTRRLDPMDRIRELSDASVPFNFDVHALFFSKDAVGIEVAMHERMADVRVNIVNRRREFFRATALEVKAHLAELAGELLQFEDVPEALEYRQGLARAQDAQRAT
jgi:hypothetical protein